ncbi:TRAP transporter small permease [Niveispirillum cyanobacteriorum]|uniref:TRAP transporter small permease protein n=1 Tax=Niveispirillum cyanobacteriorum TaxID=1612173 RepID=A0A2K9NK93_9PROT|nr:TRAP transporter small permease [Niveispirillum cyanobacteriorum]AUN33494.1 TRAP transporter small permease [Niveispirillum cyanobacteriorum]GGE48091.1 C4-dicarboxylate ABC transporter permease [Niveispirillum cyanobacteriorum]
MNHLTNLTRLASNLLIGLAGLGLVAMTAIVSWQVFGRFILNSSPSWSEQAALTLMIWFVTLAAAVGVREGFHIRITAVEDMVSPPVRKAMHVLADLVVGSIGAAMLFWGGDLVIRTWGHVIPSLGLSRGFAYLGLPLAGGLIVLFALERILKTLAGPAAAEKDVV